MSVFIVYMREDEELAESLAYALEAQKFRVLPREPVEDDPIDDMRRAKANIVLWTPNSKDKPIMVKAVRDAELRGKYVPAFADISPADKGSYSKIEGGVSGIDQRLKGLGVVPRTLQHKVKPWDPFVVLTLLIGFFLIFFIILNWQPISRPRGQPGCSDLSRDETPSNLCQ